MSVEETKPEDQESAEGVFKRRIQSMLSGEVAPPNKMMPYFLEQYRTEFQSYKEVISELGKAVQKKEALERAALKQEGRVNKIVEDLRAWDKELVDDEDDAAIAG